MSILASQPVKNNSTLLIVPKVFTDLPRCHKSLTDDVGNFLNQLTRKYLFGRRKCCYPLFAKYLQKNIHEDYNLIRDALVGLGWITCDYKHCEARYSCDGIGKSYYYGLTKKAIKSGFTFHQPKKASVIKKLARIQREAWDHDDPTLHALDFWVKHLTVDYGGALASLDAEHRGHRPLKYHLRLLPLELIQHQQLGLQKVDNQGRVYSNLTCLWSGFRKHLRLDGKRLIQLDVANSQPVFLSVLIDNKEQINNPILSLLHKDTTFCKEQFHFRGMVEEGTLYQHLHQKFSKVNPDEAKKLNRPRLKRKVFGVLYGRPSTQSPFKDVFTHEFPGIAEFIKNEKAEDYTKLPKMLQAAEAKFIIGTVCKRLVEDHPEVPILTIHDSITTTEGNADLVEKVMRQEFRKLGISPMIKKE